MEKEGGMSDADRLTIARLALRRIAYGSYTEDHVGTAREALEGMGEPWREGEHPIGKCLREAVERVTTTNENGPAS